LRISLGNAFLNGILVQHDRRAASSNAALPPTRARGRLAIRECRHPRLAASDPALRTRSRQGLSRDGVARRGRQAETGPISGGHVRRPGRAPKQHKGT
jgi:hypothetical protein